MTEVVSVRFRNTGKVYFFAPNGATLSPGDFVVVETAKGLEYGECAAGNHQVDDSAVVAPLRPVVRPATAEDKKTAAQNRDREAAAFTACQKKIDERGLDMKLVNVEYSFDGSKILFFFTSDGRVDFRELVKDLVTMFRARIELRQIGVRDGAKLLGGLGICGREFCCSSFLDDFHPVSIKMAKVQSLSLNPAKISGTCGRLMCCLKYEQAAYEDLVKSSPKQGSSILTPYGQGIVTDINLLRQTVKVRVDEGGGAGEHVIPFCDVGQSVSQMPEKPAEPKPEAANNLDRFVNLSSAPRASAPARPAFSAPRQPRPQPPKPAPQPPKPPQAPKLSPAGERLAEQAERAAEQSEQAKRRRKKRNKPQSGAQTPPPTVQTARELPPVPTPQQGRPRPLQELKKKLGETAGVPSRVQGAPQQQAQPSVPAEGGAEPKKKSSGHRRYYGKKKPGGQGGAPKAE